MKKVIVFGSSGFVGSALAIYLHGKGYIVDGCDIVNSDKLSILSDFYFSEDSQESLTIIFKNNYDICINCAGSASVPFSFLDPFKDYELNTRIVFRLLTAIKNKNPNCKFINLSSAAVYGNPQVLPISENSLIKPISPYGNHKYMSELICNQFYDYFNIDTCSLRIFSAFGPGLKKQLFWDLYQKALSSNNIKLYGTGNETRDFIFIDDLVKAIELVARQDKFIHRVINIANGIESKISDAVGFFIHFYDKNIKFEFSGEEKKGDPTSWKADTSILKSLGCSFDYDIEKGVKHYVEWLKNLKVDE